MSDSSQIPSLFRQYSRQLKKMVGEEQADKLLSDCMREADLVAVRTPQQLMSFTEAAQKKGGVMTVIARCLRTHAISAESGDPYDELLRKP
jgi:hypothetical protein